MTLKGKVPQVIPAKERVLLEGFVKANIANECAVIEQPTISALPGGIIVECCLVTLPETTPS